MNALTIASLNYRDGVLQGLTCRAGAVRNGFADAGAAVIDLLSPG